MDKKIISDTITSIFKDVPAHLYDTSSLKPHFWNKNYIAIIDEMNNKYSTLIDSLIARSQEQFNKITAKIAAIRTINTELERSISTLQETMIEIEKQSIYQAMRSYFIENLRKLTGIDCMVCICDAQKGTFLDYIPSNTVNLEAMLGQKMNDPNFKLHGFPIPEQDFVLFNTWKQGVITQGIVPAGAYHPTLKFRAYGLPVFNSQGTLLFVIGVTSDMTNEEILPQVIGAIEEMKAGSKTMTDNVTSFREIIDKLDIISKHSVEDAEEMKKNINDVNTAVSDIGDIFDRINLLALNASIEAARAGEAGRGFAVVADEVGKLADTSSSLIKTITTTITNINATSQHSLKTSDNLEKVLQVLIDNSNSLSAMYEELVAQFDQLEVMANHISLLNYDAWDSR